MKEKQEIIKDKPVNILFMAFWRPEMSFSDK